MDHLDEPPERGLRDHVGVLRRRAPVLVGVVLITVLAALVASLATPERYSATAEVLYPQQPPALQDPTRLDANRVMQNEARFVRSQTVRDPVQQRIGSPAGVRVSTVRDADSLSITATASTPERAAEIANATADVYVELRTVASAERASATLDSIKQQLTSIDDRLARIDADLPSASATVAASLDGERGALVSQRQSWQRQLDLVASGTVPTIINHASPPSKPSRPATTRNVVLASLVGLILGIAAAYALDHLDDRIRSVSDLRRLVPRLPVVAIAEDHRPRVTTPHLIHADDPLVARSNFVIDIADLVADDPQGAARVLVVPEGSTVREVRPALDAVQNSALTVLGTVFVPKSRTPPPSPQTSQDNPTPDPSGP